ncbi:MAG: hypothetical protein Q9218_008026, partial [Villophora microphyllina]
IGFCGGDIGLADDVDKIRPSCFEICAARFMIRRCGSGKREGGGCWWRARAEAAQGSVAETLPTSEIPHSPPFTTPHPEICESLLFCTLSLDTLGGTFVELSVEGLLWLCLLLSLLCDRGSMDATAESNFVDTLGRAEAGVPKHVSASKLNIIGSLLWSNTGFGTLREIKELHDYEPRYDPTVIKLSDSEAQYHTSDSQAVKEEPSFEHQETINGHYTAAYYTAAYKSGTLTPTKVVTSLLDYISANKHHNIAFLQIRRDKVLAAAAASTKRYQSANPLSALDGVPVAVKDEVDLDGYPRTLGSALNFTRKEGGTSWCVRKWENAGAVVIGKLNMHELGLDTTNNNPRASTPLNPHNPNYYTGGSSGGSASAVSSGLIPIALGADGGGSIRIPSAYCGLYGLKPTHGRISILPTTSLAASNGVVGPMASNMADLELAYRILAAPDPSHPASSVFLAPRSTPSSLPAPSHSRRKVLGICKPWFRASSPSVLSACDAALAHYINHLNYEIIEIFLPYLHEAQLAHALTILSEISTSPLPSPGLSALSAANKILLSVGKQTPATDFLLAQKMRSLLMQHLASLWEEHPGMLIVTPTTPNPGWRINGGDMAYGVSDADMSLRSMRYVWLANLTGCPAISIPVGGVEPKRSDGGESAKEEGKVPVGLMAM